MAEQSLLANELLKKAQKNRDPALVELAARQFQLLGDRQGEAKCYATLGEMRFSAGSYLESASFYQQSLEIQRALGSKQGEAQCLYFLSRCVAFTGGETEGTDERSYLSAALALAEEIADQELQAQCCVRLAACLRGDEPDTSRSLYQKALQILDKVEKGWLSAICHQSLGHLYARGSDNLKARKHYLAAIEDFEHARLSQPTSVDLRQAQCLESLGDLASKDGDEEEAMEQYEQSLAKLQGCELAGTQRVREKLERLRSLD